MWVYIDISSQPEGPEGFIRDILICRRVGLSSRESHSDTSVILVRYHILDLVDSTMISMTLQV